MKDSFMNKLKLMTIVGTRPEIIRLSECIKKFDMYFDHLLVHTGQNYDYELNEIFFNDLDIRKPDHFLEADTSSLGTAVGDIIKKSEQLFKQEKPDAILILGDTNSSLSAYMAKRMHIPIFHMEAGNRSFDLNVPEEINRKIIDHISDFNLVYTEHARRHLISEGLPHRRIYLTGSPMKEVLLAQKSKIESSTILKELDLTNKKYFVVSFHREENVDNQENLKAIIDLLSVLAEKYQYPLIISTHPRTRKRLEELKIQSGGNHLLHFLKPFSFSDYIYLQQHALCTISDSGTISEESSILNFPAISLRQSMERPEAQDTGSIILTGFSKDVVLHAIETVINEFETKKASNIPADYQIDNTSWRVLKLILGNAKLSNKWWGINE